MSSGVVKCTVSLEVFLHADELQKFKNMSLEDILYEVTDGGWIAGSPKKGDPVAIPRDELQGEMEAIGNDGSFFDITDVEELERGYGA